MSPTAVQSRIAAYEARARQNIQPDPPSLAHKSSLIDLADWVLDDMPPSPISTAPQLQLQLSSPPRQKPKPKPKPPALQTKSFAKVNKSPPLPPRRSATTDSTASDTSFLYPPLGGREALTGENWRKGNHVAGSSISSFHSVSLSSDTGTDPGTPSSLGTNILPTYPIDRVPSGSSLGESFEEISIPPPTPMPHTVAKEKPPLPQRPTTMPPSTTTPPVQQSHTSPPTPTLLPYVPRRAPPPLTSRASDRSSIQSLASSATNSGSSASRSSGSAIQTPTLLTALPLSPSPSILSTSSPKSPSATSAASAKIKRPTPVPSAARKRYATVFNANIIQRRRAEISSPSSSNNKPKKLTHAEAKATRTRQGWRGLSVDLITATPEELELADAKGKEKARDLLSERYVDENVGPDDRLEGSIVKLIWSRSRIDKSKLAEVWSECDLDSKGSLDLDSFVRGMWRIDEHLRRAQAQTSALRNASSTSLTALRSGLGSLRIKSASPKAGGLHRSASKSSLGTTSLSHSSSVSSRPTSSAKAYADYPPPPVPKIILR